MNKTTHLLSFFLFFLTALFYGQGVDKNSGIAIYKVTMKKLKRKDMAKMDSISPDKSTAKITKSIFSANTSADYVLKFNEKYTYSKPEIKPENKTKKGFNIPELYLKLLGGYQVDLSNHTVYNNTKFRDKKFLVKVDYQDIQWVITDETQNIRGYNCTKAYHMKKILQGKKLKDEKVVAWFTDEIPSQIAPYHFYGLPGGIVAVQAGGFTSILSDIKYEPVSIDFDVKVGKAMSLDEYNQMRVEYHKNN